MKKSDRLKIVILGITGLLILIGTGIFIFIGQSICTMAGVGLFVIVCLGMVVVAGKKDDQTVLRGGVLRLDGLDVLANGIDKAHRPPSLSAMAMRFNKV